MANNEKLKSIGCTEVAMYNLINNYGYIFNKNDKKYDLRHWLNCYGERVNYYTLTCVGLYKDFTTFEEALEFIREEC